MEEKETEFNFKYIVKDGKTVCVSFDELGLCIMNKDQLEFYIVLLMDALEKADKDDIPVLKEKYNRLIKHLDYIRREEFLKDE